MTRRKIVRAVDLFAGAGGASNGLVEACRELGLELELLAINHWQTAVDTHSVNHPNVVHLCESIETVDPQRKEFIDKRTGRVFKNTGRLNLMLAGPECTHFSTARGGRPVNPQSRASAWHILKWAQELYIDTILIENVPEFRTWGPIGANQKPLKSRKGETYHAFLSALRSLGYKVEDRILNAADFGDPTTRRRLFIMASRGRHNVSWPEPTHSRSGAATLFKNVAPWTTAREQVIDWSLKGKSIFTRKKALRPATMARIIAGLEKFGGPELQPFLLILRNHQAAMSIEGPVPTITGSGARVALIEPKVIPAPEHHTSFLLHTTHGGRVTDWERPSPAITGARRGELGIVEGFLLPQHGGGVLRPVTQPAPTVAGGGAISLVTSCLTKYHGTSIGAQSLDEPIGVIDGNDRHALVESFLYANDPNHPEPAPWQRDPSRLVRPVLNGWALEILYRMLLDYELAAAQSFPRNYVFMGNREKRVKQIGNAWPGELAMALCGSLVNDLVPARSKKRQEKAA